MISLFVPGTPKPQGSKRRFVNKHTGKVAVVESAGAPLEYWRGDRASHYLPRHRSRAALTDQLDTTLNHHATSYLPIDFRSLCDDGRACSGSKGPHSSHHKKRRARQRHSHLDRPADAEVQRSGPCRQSHL